MWLFSYVVRFDSGFAPNPFWDFCTLTCCKPRIRRYAEVGDLVVETGSAQTVGSHRLVYAMYVTEKLTFLESSYDARFAAKIPRNGLIEERGDNIYLQEHTYTIQQRVSYHTPEHQEHDLSGAYVLISDRFVYFGANAIEIPKKHREIIKKGPGHKSRFTAHTISEFQQWLVSLGYSGRVGIPQLFIQPRGFQEVTG